MARAKIAQIYESLRFQLLVAMLILLGFVLDLVRLFFSFFPSQFKASFLQFKASFFVSMQRFCFPFLLFKASFDCKLVKALFTSHTLLYRCTSICRCTSVYRCTSIHRCTSIYKCTSLDIYICISHVQMYIYIQMYIFIQMYIYLQMYILIYTSAFRALQSEAQISPEEGFRCSIYIS